MTELKFDVVNSKAYKLKAIRDSSVYAIESKSGYLPGFYYLVAWKGYSEEENTWEPFSAVQHLRKLIRSFYKDYLEKPTATFLPIDSASSIARPTIKLTAKFITKQKRGQPANSVNNQAKKNWTFCSFSYVAFPWPIKLFVCSIFINKRQFSSSNHPIRLRGFLPTISISNNYPYCQFSLLSSSRLRDFFINNIFNFSSAFLQG